mgnify:CR=1 FL=1
MICCPMCDVAVADVTASGRSEGVCPKCRYTYSAISGRVAQIYTKQISPATPASTRLAYELRIERNDGGTTMVEFAADEDQVMCAKTTRRPWSIR